MANVTIEKTVNFKEMDDGSHIAIHKWQPKTFINKIPRYIVCISHGMAEHALRYDEFANYLVANDAIVYIQDHRGHGKSVITEEDLGYISDTNGFQRVVLDLHTLIQSIKQEYPGVRTILLGHSFGSFVAQSYFQQFGDEIDGCILSGTAGPNFLLTIPGYLIATLVKKVKGSRYRSTFLDTMSFGSYLNRIKKPCQKKAWISRNIESVQNYEQDPFCGFLCTAVFFADLTHGLNTIHREKNIRKVRKDLPIFFITGTEDPVGAYTTTVKKLAKLYKKHDLQRVEEKYYEGGRHEMLSETNREEVYSDILSWLERI